VAVTFQWLSATSRRDLENNARKIETPIFCFSPELPDNPFDVAYIVLGGGFLELQIDLLNRGS